MTSAYNIMTLTARTSLIVYMRPSLIVRDRPNRTLGNAENGAEECESGKLLLLYGAQL